jgi:hypothetical protein
MREVVVRALPVLLPPAAVREAVSQRAEELAGLERLANEQVSDSPQDEALVGLSPTRQAAARRARQERQELIADAVHRLTGERQADEQLAAIRLALGQYLGDGARIETEGCSSQPVPAAKAGPQPPVGGPPQPLSEAPAVPAGESPEASLRRELAAARDSARTAEALLEAERQERACLEDTSAGLERRIGELNEALRAEMQKSEAERRCLEQELAEGKQELAADRRKSAALGGEVARLAEALRQAEGSLATARAECRRLQDESSKARGMEAKAVAGQTERNALVGQVAELSEALRQANARLAEQRGAQEALDAEKKALAKRLGRERSARERLEAEKAELEARLLAGLAAGTPAAASAEAGEEALRRLEVEKTALERRTTELAEGVRLASERAAAEQQERTRLAAVVRDLERQLAELRRAPVRAAAGIVPLPAAAGPAPPVAAPRPSVPGAFFQVDLELAGIDYVAAEEVAELHQGLCMIQLSLEGYPSQYCAGYIIGLQQGRSRQVFVAFRLSASGRNLVYRPTHRPRNQAEYGKALREAIKFLRVVGLETEPLPLPAAPGERCGFLAAVPVLNGPPRSVQGF